VKIESSEYFDTYGPFNHGSTLEYQSHLAGEDCNYPKKATGVLGGLPEQLIACTSRFGWGQIHDLLDGE